MITTYGGTRHVMGNVMDGVCITHFGKVVIPGSYAHAEWLFRLAKSEAGQRPATDPPPPMVTVGRDGWVRATERMARAGFEYAVAHGSMVPGGRRRRARVYYYMVRRPYVHGRELVAELRTRMGPAHSLALHALETASFDMWQVASDAFEQACHAETADRLRDIDARDFAILSNAYEV